MTILHQLNTLESTGLVRLISARPAVEYIFRHALIHDAVHESIVKRDRSALHRLVGETLEQLYPDRLGSRDLAPMLAQHFDRGQDDRRALKYYTLAADAAFESFANLEAIDHYTHAIEIARDDENDRARLIHLYTRRGRAFELSGQYAQADANYLEMERLAREHIDPHLELAALMCRATIYIAPTSVHDHAKGEALLGPALDLARRLNDRAAEAKVLWNTLLLYRFKGNPQLALQIGEEALALARELDLKELTAFILNDLYAAYFTAGQLEQGLRVIHEAQHLWREVNNLAMLADSLSGEVEINIFLGEYDRALAAFDRARSTSESIGNLWNQSYSRYMIGLVYWERGEISQAIQVMEDCIRLGEQAGFIVSQVLTRCELAIVQAELGNDQIGFELVAEALATVDRTLPAGRALPLSVKALLLVLKNDLAEAEELMRQIDPATPSELEVFNVYYQLAAGELAIRRHNYPAAIEAADQLCVGLARIGIRPFVYDALAIKGRALLAQDQIDDAEAALTEARRRAEEIGSRHALLSILPALHTIELRRGNELAAYQLLQQAREIIGYTADHIESAEVRKSYLNLPGIRAIRPA